MPTISEDALEKGLIRTLQDMNYEYVDVKEENNLQANLKRQLEKHNRKELERHGRTVFTEEEFKHILIHLEGGTRFEKAKKLRDRFALEVGNGEHIWVEFLNSHQWCQNEFQVANQITVEGRKKCRYDVTILINGLPLVQIELKRAGVELKQAYNQIQRYHKTSFRGLFDYIQIFVVSNSVNTRYFANNPNGGYKFTFKWTDAANIPFSDLNSFATQFLDKCTLGKILTKYIVLHESDKCLMVLRPYQYYAVENILDRVQNTSKNGYIWHTTGAGKTLTSFKAAQLVQNVDGVEKVLFVVDRHDLDTQTKMEYDAFEPGAVDGTDSTAELIQRLESGNKIIITTIQKLNAAVKKKYYNRHLCELQDKKVVMIFDECHRSHFGESHRNIVRFFHNLQIFGFTGTPIFVENAKQDKTTKEVFGECLHKYLIKDAIADENVLGFLVEYYAGREGVDEMSTARMTEIAHFILNNYNKSTFDGEFNALFAVQSVPMLLKYYKIFKELKPAIKIGAIFTYAANDSQDDVATGMGTGNFANEKVHADELQSIMDDYNGMFGTSFTTETFAAYYDDINLRMKKKRADMEPLDLLIVVGMFLTGFDAKKLNTLYVDKNLEYHGLLQAFSRTNRVLNDKKRFGKVLCFRDLKSNVDSSLKLFSNSNNLEDILRDPYAKVFHDYTRLQFDFKSHYPAPHVVDYLQTEEDKKNFVLAFRELLKKRAEIKIYNEYDSEDPRFPIDEQMFNEFLSKYLDILEGAHPEPADIEPTGNGHEPAEDNPLEDIDFCLELLHSDIINVAYIIALIEHLDPTSADYQDKRKAILDTMIKDVTMRNKTKLIDSFIRKEVDDDQQGFMKGKADGSIDLETRLNNFVAEERNKALIELAEQENMPIEALKKFMDEYEYLHREKSEIIRDAVKDKAMKYKERKSLVSRVLTRLHAIVSVFFWE